jgi:hypothetical protein
MNPIKTHQIGKWLASFVAATALTGSQSLPAQTWQVLAPQSGFAPAGSGVSVLMDPFTDLANPGIFLATMQNPGTKSIYRLKPNPAFPAFAYEEVHNGVFNDLRRLDYVPNDGTLNGTLYAIGQSPANRFTAWKVLKSLDKGNSWTDDGTFYLGKGNTSLAQGLASDAAGIAYACGHAYGSAGNDRHWIVRRKLSGSAGWMTVSDISNKSPGNGALAMCSFPGNAANPTPAVFAAGYLNYKWTVMHSQNQGGTWQQAGAASWPTGYPYAMASDAACDGAGNIYVAGYYFMGGGYAAGCVVQTSGDGGNTWITLLDDNSSTPTGTWRLAIDNSGYVTLSGKISDSTGGNSRWTVVRPANPQVPAHWAASYLAPLQPFPNIESGGGPIAADVSGNLFLGGCVVNWNGYTGAGLLRMAP